MNLLKIVLLAFIMISAQAQAKTFVASFDALTSKFAMNPKDDTTSATTTTPIVRHASFRARITKTTFTGTPTAPIYNYKEICIVNSDQIPVYDSRPVDYGFEMPDLASCIDSDNGSTVQISGAIDIKKLKIIDSMADVKIYAFEIYSDSTSIPGGSAYGFSQDLNQKDFLIIAGPSSSYGLPTYYSATIEVQD